MEGVGKHWIELCNGFSQIFADKLVCLGFGNSLSSPFSVDRINAKYVVLFSPPSSVFEVHSSMFGLKFEFVSRSKKYLYRLQRREIFHRFTFSAEGASKPRDICIE